MNKVLLRKLILEALSEEERNTLYSNAGNEKELKKAYRKLVTKHHPDRANEEDRDEATSTTQEINSIYDELSNKNSNTQRSQQTNSQQGSHTTGDPKKSAAKKMQKSKNIVEFFDGYVEFAKAKYGENSKKSKRALQTKETFLNQTYSFWINNLGSLDNLGMSIGSLKPANLLASHAYTEFARAYLEQRESVSGFVQYYLIAADHSALNLTASGHEKVVKSKEAVQGIKDMMGFLKRTKYMFFGPSQEELEKMENLIKDVSPLMSEIDFQALLRRVILE